MTNIVGSCILIGFLLALILIRVPVVFALGLSSLLSALYLHIPLLIVGERMISGLNNFTFLAVPFFVLLGHLMTDGGISERLVRLSDSLIGRVRGGLAQVNILTNLMFGGISGSAIADVASIGTFMIPAMRSRGFTGEYATAVTVTSSIEGVLIPPSQNMIYYSLAAGGLPISQLFIAGYIPGILFAVSLMALAFYMACRYNHPTGNPSSSWREKFRAILNASLGLFTIVIIMGGILAGIFTATESAAVAVFYGLIITVFVYRSLSWRELYGVLHGSMKTLAMVISILMTSSAFGYMTSVLQIPEVLSEIMFEASSSPYVIIFLINLILIFLGMLMDMGVLILILTPILLPVAKNIGIDPIHFGMIMMTNLGLGLITPPVGTSLIAGASIGKVSIEKLTKSILPFYALYFVLIMIVTYVPAISLFLPSLISSSP